ncbi:hypothetical protein Mapa_017241 [Marchantia paleacea]|nr:hypothetical protein Mapa_017241 [Marchantia paleacea]
MAFGSTNIVESPCCRKSPHVLAARPTFANPCAQFAPQVQVLVAVVTGAKLQCRSSTILVELDVVHTFEHKDVPGERIHVQTKMRRLKVETRRDLTKAWGYPLFCRTAKSNWGLQTFPNATKPRSELISV